jgi:outer membrane protein OmpA-like peptidoglycan-associated protein
MQGRSTTKRAGDKPALTAICPSWRDRSGKYRSMSASPIDSGDALPLHEADRPADATPEIGAGNKTQPKARTRRPRPTFDDGSVARVFKFPSKTYPRSSYYVTSTEVIVRIKKARKKWKLVVPKKRMVATNRWFAKPRWVEIELTYTQALKLGLVEPRTPATEITSGTSAEQQVATQSSVGCGHTLTDGSGSEPEPDSTSTRLRVSEPDQAVEQAEPLFDIEHVDFVSDVRLEEDAVFPRSRPYDGSQLRVLPPLPTAHADIRSSQSLSAAAAARAGTDRVAFRASATLLLIASSVLVLLSGAAGWVTLGGTSTAPMTADLACMLSEQSSSCTQIVTGAIGKAEQPRSREAESSATHASSESVRAIEQFQLSAPEIAATLTEHDGSAKVGSREDNGSELTGAADASAEGDPLPAATIAKTALLAPQEVPADRYDCRELGATSQSIHISFDYGSSGLQQVALPALELFAVKLRLCPSAKVTVEGHTDSDGSVVSNQSLSVRRAKAVLERLVHAGVSPDQLSAIGFGQSRPHAPNVSSKNKRSNRRVALVVDVRR